MLKTKYTKEYKVLASRLKQARCALKLTQYELAERMTPTSGLDTEEAQRQLWRTQRYISLCEQGEKRLDLLQLFHYCRCLDLDFTEFVEELLQDWREFNFESPDEFTPLGLDPF